MGIRKFGRCRKAEGNSSYRTKAVEGGIRKEVGRNREDKGAGAIWGEGMISTMPWKSKKWVR